MGDVEAVPKEPPFFARRATPQFFPDTLRPFAGIIKSLDLCRTMLYK